jgi:hypothetical protein
MEQDRALAGRRTPAAAGSRTAAEASIDEDFIIIIDAVEEMTLPDSRFCTSRCPGLL